MALMSNLKEMLRKLLLLTALLSLVVRTRAVAHEENILVMARAADTTGLDPHTRTAFASFRLLEQDAVTVSMNDVGHCSGYGQLSTTHTFVGRSFFFIFLLLIFGVRG